MGSSIDLADVEKEFEKLLVEEFISCREIGLSYLKADVASVTVDSNAKSKCCSNGATNCLC